jgi:hypothetical protein
MNPHSRHQRLVGWISVLAGAFALACLVVGALAVDFDFDAFADPVRTLAHARHDELAYWFNILDLFGYYLLLLPVAMLLHLRYRDRSPWMELITVSGVAYVIIGACGAAVLAAVWPPLMRDHLVASPDTQATIALVFRTATLAVTTGLWNTLEMVLAATWWIGLGMLSRRDTPVVGGLALATGVACALDALGNLVRVGVLSELGLNGYLLLSIVWSIALGVRLLREPRRATAPHAIIATAC